MRRAYHDWNEVSEYAIVGNVIRNCTSNDIVYGTALYEEVVSGNRESRNSLIWDPGSLIDGAWTESGDLYCYNAEFGDFVLVSPPYSLQGIICTGYVKAAGNIRIALFNHTSGTINLAEGTWRIRLLKD